MSLFSDRILDYLVDLFMTLIISLDYQPMYIFPLVAVRSQALEINKSTGVYGWVSFGI